MSHSIGELEEADVSDEVKPSRTIFTHFAWRAL